MTNEIIQFIIEEKSGRLDKVLSNHLKETSRSQIQMWISDSLVRINDETVTTKKFTVQEGDQVLINVPEPKEISTEAENIDIDIVYEDEDVAVVNKPQEMVVHPSAGHHSGTLVNALLYHIKDLSGINGQIRPGIVHRIDKDTSGLLMVAKNDRAHQGLAKQLQEKTTLREYVGIVHGVIPHDKGTVKAPIGRDPKNRKKFAVVDDGKESVTHFEVIERFDEFTFIKLHLETGRTHQIRVHMDYIGYPLAGDPLYGPRKTLEGNGQFLHAKTLGFEHPTTKEQMQFDSEIPEIFQKTIEYLRKRMK